MQYASQWLRWGLFLAVLIAVGGVVFVQVRYRPRCVIHAKLHLLNLSADGTRMVAVTRVQDPELSKPAIVVWDLVQGRQERVLLEDIAWDHFVLSPDQRHLGVSLGDGTVRLIDWRNSDQDGFRIEPSRRRALEFSPKGKWLYFGGFIDMAQRKMGPVRTTEQLIGFDAAEERAFFRKPDGSVSIWSLQTGEKQRELAVKDSLEAPDLDGPPRFGLAPHRELDPGAEGGGRTMFRYAWWDLQTLKKRCTSPFIGEPGPARIILENNEYLVIEDFVERGKARLLVLELTTGRIAVSASLGEIKTAGFLSNGSVLCVVHDNWQTATMFELPDGRKLWHKHGGRVSSKGDTGILLYQDGMNHIEGLDARSGERVWALASEGSLSGGSYTHDGSHFLAYDEGEREPYFWEPWLQRIWPHFIAGSHCDTLVIETRTGRELFRLRNSGTQEFQLSQDASTLLGKEVVRDAEGSPIRVWDVHPRRAWIWAITSALAAGAGLLLLRRAWKSWRTPRAAAGRS
jgi:WD40 repeat protein